MIRANFHIDPYALAEDEWAERFAEAAWLEGARLTNLAKVLGRLFGGGDV